MGYWDHLICDPSSTGIVALRMCKRFPHKSGPSSIHRFLHDSRLGVPSSTHAPLHLSRPLTRIWARPQELVLPFAVVRLRLALCTMNSFSSRDRSPIPTKSIFRPLSSSENFVCTSLGECKLENTSIISERWRLHCQEELVPSTKLVSGSDSFEADPLGMGTCCWSMG